MRRDDPEEDRTAQPILRASFEERSKRYHTQGEIFLPRDLLL